MRIDLLAAQQRARNGRDRLVTRAVRGSFAAWGDGSIMRMPFRVEGAGGISIGADVFIGDNSWLMTHGAATISIGNRCNFSGLAVIAAASEIVLEDDVLLARNVHVLDHQHRFDDLDVPVHAQGVADSQPVRICRGAWVGANTVVLPGVTIGSNAVVGANSVVREDVPARAVAVGAPARVVRSLESGSVRGATERFADTPR